MTDAKKLKQRVRQRAARTGESYSSARRHVVKEVDANRQARTAAAADKARSSASKGTVSEAKCIEKTGFDFDHWFGVLDTFKAPDKGHTAAARHLKDDHKVPAWYAQGLTVAYERARGLRAVNQSCAGDFEVSVSRVLPSSLDGAVAAISRQAIRKRWLPDVENRVSGPLVSALNAKRFRVKAGERHLRYRGDEGTVVLSITEKDDGRSTIRVIVNGLSGKESVERERASWRAALDRFRKELASPQDGGHGGA